MVDKSLHVRLNTEVPELTAVSSLGSGIIPCCGVTVEFEPKHRPTLVLRVLMHNVDLEVVGDKEGS